MSLESANWVSRLEVVVVVDDDDDDFVVAVAVVVVLDAAALLNHLEPRNGFSNSLRCQLVINISPQPSRNRKN